MCARMGKREKLFLSLQIILVEGLTINYIWLLALPPGVARAKNTSGSRVIYIGNIITYKYKFKNSKTL